jgi:methylenetetrahydrofolate dehydrogenase (NADP+) / methenyltetrahydrofolate cyclohydrolase
VTPIDGKAIADQLMTSLAERSQALSQRGIRPSLCFVTIGDSKPAQMYLRRLEKLGGKAGVEVTTHGLPAEVTLKELDSSVASLNADPTIDGIIVQMPLPSHLTYADLAEIIEPRKDVDGITIRSGGLLYLGLPGHPPSTASAMMHILEAVGVKPRGCNAVVVGRSNVVGHPVAELLIAASATVTVTHSKTRDLAFHTRQAEILMVAAGRPLLITGDMIRSGVVVIDAGINPTAVGVVGDVDFEQCKDIASAITPVPGGVGPVTNAVLLRNLVDSAERRE